MNRKYAACALLAAACPAMIATADFTGVIAVDVSSELGTPDGLTTYRLYAQFDDPTDQLLWVGGDADVAALVFSTDAPGGLYNDGGEYSQLKPEDFPFILSAPWDSWVTIGSATFTLDNDYSPGFLGSDGIHSVIQGSSWSQADDGGWFDAAPSTPQDGGHILIAQFTIASAFELELQGTIAWNPGGGPPSARSPFNSATFLFDGNMDSGRRDDKRYLKVHRIESPLGTTDGRVDEVFDAGAVGPRGPLLIGSWNMEQMPGGFGSDETLETRIDNQVRNVVPILEQSGVHVLLGQEAAGHHGVLWLNHALPSYARFRYVITSSYTRARHSKWDFHSQRPWIPAPSPDLPYFEHALGPIWNLAPYEGPSEGDDIWAYRKKQDDYPANRRYECFIMSNWPVTDCWEVEYIERKPVDPAYPFGVAARGALVARLDVGGVPVWMCSVHLASPQEHLEDLKRGPQIELLLEFLGRPVDHPDGGAGADMRPGSGDIVIIAGDFNGRPDDDVERGGMPGGEGINNQFQQPLFEAGFRNAWMDVPDTPRRHTKDIWVLDYFYTLNAGHPRNSFDGDARVVPNSKRPRAGDAYGTADHALITLDLGPVFLLGDALGGDADFAIDAREDPVLETADAPHRR